MRRTERTVSSGVTPCAVADEEPVRAIIVTPTSASARKQARIVSTPLVVGFQSAFAICRLEHAPDRGSIGRWCRYLRPMDPALSAWSHGAVVECVKTSTSDAGGVR